MTRILTCGYGLHDLNVEPRSSSTQYQVQAPATIDLTTAVSRYAGASVVYSSSADGFAYSQFPMGGISYPMSVRIYVRFGSFPDSSCRILEITNSTADPMASIAIESNGTLTLRGPSSGGSVQLGSASSTLSTGTWYGVELRLAVAETPKVEGRVWTDSTSPGAFASSSDASITQNGRGLKYGACQQGPAGLILYITDVAVNEHVGSYNTGYPGKGRIVYLHPDGAGDNNEWLKSGGGSGTTTNYQDVDETPPDDSTTYLKRTSGQPVDFYTVASSSSAGINSNDTITTVDVWYRAGATSSTATADRTLISMIKGETGGTIRESDWSADISTSTWCTNIDSSTSPSSTRPTPLSAAVNPQNSQPWTAATIDTMQIGAKPGTSSTTEVRLSSIWAVVEYIATTTADGTAPGQLSASSTTLVTGHASGTASATLGASATAVTHLTQTAAGSAAGTAQAAGSGSISRGVSGLAEALLSSVATISGMIQADGTGQAVLAVQPQAVVARPAAGVAAGAGSAAADAAVEMLEVSTGEAIGGAGASGVPTVRLAASGLFAMSLSISGAPVRGRSSNGTCLLVGAARGAAAEAIFSLDPRPASAVRIA